MRGQGAEASSKMWRIFLKYPISFALSFRDNNSSITACARKSGSGFSKSMALKETSGHSMAAVLIRPTAAPLVGSHCQPALWRPKPPPIALRARTWPLHSCKSLAQACRRKNRAFASNWLAFLHSFRLVGISVCPIPCAKAIPAMGPICARISPTAAFTDSGLHREDEGITADLAPYSTKRLSSDREMSAESETTRKTPSRWDLSLTLGEGWARTMNRPIGDPAASRPEGWGSEAGMAVPGKEGSGGRCP